MVGTGTMGAGITTTLLNAGLAVTQIDNTETLAVSGTHIALTVDRDVVTGRLDPDAAVAISLARQRWCRARPARRVEALAGWSRPEQGLPNL